MEYYELWTGDTFGFNCSWILCGPLDLAIDKLKEEFRAGLKDKTRHTLKELLKELRPDWDSEGDYLEERVFVTWLCKHHGMTIIDTTFFNIGD